MVNAREAGAVGRRHAGPVACIEYEDYRCLRRSYYVCRHWPHDQDLTALLYRGVPSGADARALLEALAQFTAAQHDRGVLHLDYNPGNILVRSENDGFEFALVDLNRLRFRPLNIGDRISGLVRLTTRDDCLRIIGRRYARLCTVPIRMTSARASKRRSVDSRREDAG